jgi:hypothetical protein
MVNTFTTTAFKGKQVGSSKNEMLLLNVNFASNNLSHGRIHTS